MDTNKFIRGEEIVADVQFLPPGPLSIWPGETVDCDFNGFPAGSIRLDRITPDDPQPDENGNYQYTYHFTVVPCTIPGDPIP